MLSEKVTFLYLVYKLINKRQFKSYDKDDIKDVVEAYGMSGKVFADIEIEFNGQKVKKIVTH